MQHPNIQKWVLENKDIFMILCQCSGGWWSQENFIFQIIHKYNKIALDNLFTESQNDSTETPDFAMQHPETSKYQNLALNYG